MDDKILALVKTNQNRRLMPEEIAAVNAYVIAGKTADLVQLGTEVGSNAISYHKSKTKLSDHGEYLGAVKAGFDRLPKDGRIDGCAKWTRWMEATFHVYDKVQRDYFTKLAKQHIKLMRDEVTKPKPNYKTLALDLARMVLNGDRDGAEKLAQQITQDSGEAKTEKAENSAFSTETEEDDVKPTPAPPAAKKQKTASKTHARNAVCSDRTICRWKTPAADTVFAADGEKPTCKACLREIERVSRIEWMKELKAAEEPAAKQRAKISGYKTHAHGRNDRTRCGRPGGERAIFAEDGEQPSCGLCIELLRKSAVEKAEREANLKRWEEQEAAEALAAAASDAAKVDQAPTPANKQKRSTGLIYEPGGITEFALLALNREVGCVHDCKYCYGPASMHVKRKDWTTPRVKENFLENLRLTLEKRERDDAPKHQVLMEYSGDCYGDPKDTMTGESIKMLHDFGYGVCILTKAPMNAVKNIALFDPKIDCFGSTITTFDPVELAEWEPKAPCPQDRLAALKEFHDAGIYTWISMEPIISPATSLRVIELTHQCVDHYKTGLMNVRGMKLPNGYANHDWKAYAADFIKAVESHGRTWYAKHTLEPYLPAGAVNEKFRPMCHGIPSETQETHAPTAHNSTKAKCGQFGKNVQFAADGSNPTCGRCLKKLQEAIDRKSAYEKQESEVAAYKAERVAEFKAALGSLADGKDAQIGNFDLRLNDGKVLVVGPEDYRFDNGNNWMEFATPLDAVKCINEEECLGLDLDETLLLSSELR